MFSIRGDNPTLLYFNTLFKVTSEGEETSPRGKLVKELRPAAVIFENPLKRMTFLGSRRINPFFQLAESFWILSGRSDVSWLDKFNSNMKSFSDDGVFFNAAYGERIRSWNKNSMKNVIINPVDQLYDVFVKLLTDKDTRQAVIVISNPMFDNSIYTVTEKGLDIACNLVITFKIRNNKLHMTVFNRSNDVHWGLWGANLCQFTTIQELLASWLRASKVPGYEDIQVGEYTQLTDSLHVYMDDYGSKITSEIFDYYSDTDWCELDVDFSTESEPRMSLSQQKFDSFVDVFWKVIYKYFEDDYLSVKENYVNLLDLISDLKSSGTIDSYWEFVFRTLVAYRAYRLLGADGLKTALEILQFTKRSEILVSMLHFLKNAVSKTPDDSEERELYSSICSSFEKYYAGKNLEVFKKYLS